MLRFVAVPYEVLLGCSEFRTAAGRVADLKHFYADPDPDFHCNTVPDTDPAFHFNADPDPASHKSGTNLQPLVYGPSRAPF
jgi:hypothetical protein